MILNILLCVGAVSAVLTGLWLGEAIYRALDDKDLT